MTNWKGGNISLKQTEAGFDGEPLRVLRVKGSGSDLKTAQRDDFVGVALDPVLRIQSRPAMSDGRWSPTSRTASRTSRPSGRRSRR